MIEQAKRSIHASLSVLKMHERKYSVPPDDDDGFAAPIVQWCFGLAQGQLGWAWLGYDEKEGEYTENASVGDV